MASLATAFGFMHPASLMEMEMDTDSGEYVKLAEWHVAKGERIFEHFHSDFVHDLS